MLYEFELSHNAEETPKNICDLKVEGTFDPSTVTFNSIVQEILIGFEETRQSENFR